MTELANRPAQAGEDLLGRVALVTGGSRGVGAAVVRELSARGAHVAFTYRRAEDEAEQVVASTVDHPGRVLAFRAPIEDAAANAVAVEAVRSTLGPIDLFVSNAGTASSGRSVADTPMDEFQRLMNVHTWGPLTLVRSLLPEMRLRDRADVVVISSVSTDAAPALSAPYTMAKAALEMAVRTLAREERVHGIRANVVAPGLIATDMGARLVAAVLDGAQLADLDASAPFGRVCRPEDVSAVVGFLAGGAAGYVTGQRIVVDGGGPDVRAFEH